MGERLAQPRLQEPRQVEDLEEVLDSISEQITFWDENRCLVFANRCVRQWLGRTRSELRNVSLSDLVGLEVADHLDQFFSAASRDGVVTYRRRMPGPDGDGHTIAIRLAARTSDGRSAGYAMFGTDRTLTLDARQQQQRAEMRTQLVSERERIAIELDERIRSVLQDLLAVLSEDDGAANANWPTLDAVGVLDGVIASIRDIVAGLRSPLPAMSDQLPSVPFGGVPGPWHTGTAVVAPWTPAGSSTDDDGSSWTFEEALAFIDDLPGITVWDVEQVNCFGNRIAVEGVGRSRRSEMIGRTRRQLFGPDVAARSGPYAEAAAHGRAQRYDSTFVDGAGTRRSVHFVYDPIMRGGRPVGLVATLNDVDPTELDHSDARVTALTDDRARIAEDLHDHVIQHLYAAGMALESAGSGIEAASLAQHAAGCVASAIAVLTASVHDLHEDVSSGLVDAIDDALRRAAPALGVVPNLDTIGNLASVGADLSSDVLAVLTESLSNIARHAGADDVHVTVSAGGGAVWLSVADNGKGIDTLTRSSGLTNLGNRATRRGGTFEHRPNIPRGTVIDWRVPI